MENVRKHGNIKLVTTKRRRNYLVSDPNYHTIKFFIENLLAIEMRKTQILINQPVYLCLSVLDLICYTQIENKIDYLEKNKIDIDSSFC